MAIYNIIGDKTLQWAPGGVYGLISVIIGIYCNLIAVLLFPGYNITINMISELGVGPGGLFFNLGFIISGLMAIPFYISLGRTLDGEDVNINLIKSAKVSSIISCVTFSLIGFFPAIPENEIILIMHGIIALISLTCAAIYLIFFSILMLKNKNFSKLQAYLGFFFAGLVTLFLLTWWPITEWFLTLAITLWVSINSSYLIYKRI